MGTGVGNCISCMEANVPNISVGVCTVTGSVVTGLASSLALSALLRGIASVCGGLTSSPIGAVFRLLPIVIIILSSMLIPLLFGRSNSVCCNRVGNVITGLLGSGGLARTANDPANVNRVN